MKRSVLKLTASLLLAAALFASPVTTALAEDAASGNTSTASQPVSTPTPAPTLSPSPEPTVSPEPTATPSLEPTPTVDPGVANPTGNAYVVAATVTDTAGGEVSTVNWGDRVNIVLKIVDRASAKFNVQPEEISARVNSSVFTFTGTAEIGQFYEENDDPSGQNDPAYNYYSYVLLFRDVIYNGGGSDFAVTLSYIDNALPIQDINVHIGQCVDEDPNDPSKARAPSLIVRQSSYGTETITAGSPFTLSLTIYAASGTESLSDVVASVTLPEGVTMTGGSLSTYVGSMSPQSTRDVSFNLQASSGFTGGVANITVNLVGAGATSGNSVTGSTTISVPISQPDRFELGQLQISDTIYVGNSTTVTLNFVNKGKNPVSNLEASISGENLGADMTQQYIGNVNAGTENSVDFDLMPMEAGPMTGTITLSYEAEDGSLKTVTKDFSATVMDMPTYDDMGMMDPGMDMEVQPAGFPVWGIVLIVVAVIAVAVIVVVVIRKKKKAAALASLEDDDEDL